MIRRIFITLSSCLALLATHQVSAEAEEYSSSLHRLEVTTVAEGLRVPWSMTWLPNGDMLVTERPGRLRIIRNGKHVVLRESLLAGIGRIRNIHEGPDGAIYIATENRGILRLTPAD